MSGTLLHNKVLGPVLDDFGFGLLASTQGAGMDYQPFEVSKLSLGIVCIDALELGARFTLHSPLGKISLEVLEDAGSVPNTSYHRFRLKAVDSKVDLERVFAQSGAQRKLAVIDKVIQCARFKVEPAIKVKAKTFGARDQYGLQTIDISKSGMLLLAQASERVPFIVNTLLEVEVEAPGWLKQPVTGLAKVIRNGNRSVDGSRHQEFGIRFIEFNEEGTELWKTALNKIEASLKPNP